MVQREIHSRDNMVVMVEREREREREHLEGTQPTHQAYGRAPRGLNNRNGIPAGCFQVRGAWVFSQCCRSPQELSSV